MVRPRHHRHLPVPLLQGHRHRGFSRTKRPLRRVKTNALAQGDPRGRRVHLAPRALGSDAARILLNVLSKRARSRRRRRKMPRFEGNESENEKRSAASSHASRAFGVAPDARGSRVAPRHRGRCGGPGVGARGSTPRRRRGGGTSGSTERCWLLSGVAIRTIRVTRARVAAWTTRTGRRSTHSLAFLLCALQTLTSATRGNPEDVDGAVAEGAVAVRARARARICHGGPARGRARRGLHGRAGASSARAWSRPCR